MSGILVDSNILVYGHDPRDVHKQLRAQAVLQVLAEGDLAVLSVQSLTEFYRAVRWRLPDPLNPQDALAQVERLAQSFPVFDLTDTIVIAGCTASGQYQLSIWDALIWGVAKVNGVPNILTEDGQHGRVIEDVRYLNPFHPAFEMRMLEA